MLRDYHFSSFILVLSALVLAVLCIIPETKDLWALRIIASGMHVGDTFFHEIGHSVVYCLFGKPAVPMIFTVFGADQAGGMSMTFGERSLLFQLFSAGIYAYGCKWLYDHGSRLFIPACIVWLAVLALSFSRYTDLIVAFMGHGSSILVGGFFLYRGLVPDDTRSGLERWLNAFFGFSLIGVNLYFACGIAFDAARRNHYSNLTLFGAGHHDLVIMSEELPSLSLQNAALFTVGFSLVILLTSVFLAYFSRDADYE